MLVFSALTTLLATKLLDQSSCTLTTVNSQKLTDSVLVISNVFDKVESPIMYVRTPKSEFVQISESHGSEIVTSSKYESTGRVLMIGALKLMTIL